MHACMHACMRSWSRGGLAGLDLRLLRGLHLREHLVHYIIIINTYMYVCMCIYIYIYIYFHSIPVATPPEGGIGGAAHNRSWYH